MVRNVLYCISGYEHEIICIESADVASTDTGAIQRSSPVEIPDDDVRKRIPPIMPVFQENFMAREHGSPAELRNGILQDHIRISRYLQKSSTRCPWIMVSGKE